MSSPGAAARRWQPGRALAAVSQRAILAQYLRISFYDAGDGSCAACVDGNACEGAEQARKSQSVGSDGSPQAAGAGDIMKNALAEVVLIGSGRVAE